MWIWRRRSTFAKLNMPHKCFISHSYRDADARDRLLSLLPRSVEAVVFPPIMVEPDKYISSKLIEAILGCQGLIYLTREASAESFWVSFERDFALRAKKQVYAYDQTKETLTPDTGVPARMPIYTCYARLDHHAVQRIVQFLCNERDVANVWSEVNISKFIRNQDATRMAALDYCANSGGYVVVFWSQHSYDDQPMMQEIEMAKDAMFGSRFLVAQLDDTPVPKMLFPPDLNFASVHSITPRTEQVQLYGDDVQSQAHRIDDLVVRLYWLIYQQRTFPWFRPEEPRY